MALKVAKLPDFWQNLLFKNNFVCLQQPPGGHIWNWYGLVGRPNVWSPKWYWQLSDQLIRSLFWWHINTTTPYMLYFTAVLAIAKVSKWLIYHKTLSSYYVNSYIPLQHWAKLLNLWNQNNAKLEYDAEKQENPI